MQFSWRIHLCSERIIAFNARSVWLKKKITSDPKYVRWGTQHINFKNDTAVKVKNVVARLVTPVLRSERLGECEEVRAVARGGVVDDVASMWAGVNRTGTRVRSTIE